MTQMIFQSQSNLYWVIIHQPDFYISDGTQSHMLPVEQSEPRKERSCDSLMMCIVTTLNYGLRNGGGIGDVLRSPSNTEPLFPARVIYDMLFFFLVIIIVLNLIFGVIIDTFADLRAEKQEKEETLKNSCFICGKTFRQLLFICHRIPSLRMHSGQFMFSKSVIQL